MGDPYELDFMSLEIDTVSEQQQSRNNLIIPPLVFPEVAVENSFTVIIYPKRLDITDIVVHP